ncbi:hypothetical protein LTS18_001482 [Coniosporium uncinatum]|uniref:Uncharacterized protein n=1 Tax=Coniosporium uncinatum TaxID=93489 RepID=A0ACC3DF69_9PEZI|nr:hypothetical protein LTS18_001482 [Coniosporium uncinatum]
MKRIEKVVERYGGRSGGKVVVYGNTIGKVRRMAERLGCEAYHRKTVGKEEVLAEFQAGRQKVITATSALGMGIDIPDIRCIVHVDRPRTLLDYAQESGRAGRDGRVSVAIVIKNDGEGPEKGQEQSVEEKKYRKEQNVLVERYLWGEEGVEGCRRVVLDGHLDGREDRGGCEEGEGKCDVCGGAEDNAAEEEGGEEEGEGRRGAGGRGGDVERVGEDVNEEIEGREFRGQGQERRAGRERMVRDHADKGLQVEILKRLLSKWWQRCGICEGGRYRGRSTE